MPTVGKLQKDINVLNNNVKRLSGLNDNSVHIIDGQSTKKIFLSDLNREPNKIDFLNTVNQFNSTNNWFFESLMNPMLSVNFDLTDKVESSVDGVISRRYIVKFERDNENNLTDAGLQAKNDLENFKGSESQKAEFAKLQAENVAKEKAEIDKKLAEQSQKEAEKTQKEQIQQQKEVAKTGEQYDNLIGRLSTLNQKQQEYTDKTKESTKIADSQKIADIRDQLAKLGTANFGQMGIMNDGTAPTPATTPTTPINQGQVILSKEI
jgi:hypothetical protein